MWYLGVDGGGTKTTAVLVDERGVERGRGTAGSGNQTAVGRDRVLANIAAAVGGAAANAGTAPSFAAAWVGLSGVDLPVDTERFAAALAGLAPVVRATNDAELPLSVLPGAVGVALVAGTGSIACGTNADGLQARAGGWGWRLGDEGSGYGIGCAALVAVARAADERGAPTALREQILSAWHLTQPADLIGIVYGGKTNADIAALSALVFDVARAGDTVAQRIVDDGARELACAVVAVAHSLRWQGALSLAFTGGLLLHEAAYRDAVITHVRQTYPVSAVKLVDDPALSAARSLVAAERRV